jgi:protease I
MAYELRHQQVAFVVANEGIEEAELLRPWHGVVNAGAEAELVAPAAGMAQIVRGGSPVGRFPVDRVTDGARAAAYDAAVLPGGAVNADELRTDAAAVDFLMAMFEAGKPVATVSHGIIPLIDGDLLAGRTVTSCSSLQTDLRNARAHWVDREVVVCRHGINTLVTGRASADLGMFCRALTREFARSPVAV